MKNALNSFIVFFILTFNCIYGHKAHAQTKLLPSDFRIFERTNAWELAKAIDKEDTNKIRRILYSNKKLVNVVDPKFGQTLLGLAVIDQKFNSVKTLLELGADPNAYDNYIGQSALMKTFSIEGSIPENDTNYLKLLLKYGGNPNLRSKHVDYGPEPMSTLSIACDANNLNALRILIEAGADFKSDWANILYSALISRNPDIVILLLDKGIEFKKPMNIYHDGTKVYIANELRDWTFDLGSEKYKKKMQIVDFLKQHGIDYRATKIPKKYYSLYSKEYLARY